MKSPTRSWFKIGYYFPIMTLIDFNINHPVGWVEVQMSEKSSNGTSEYREENPYKSSWEPEEYKEESPVFELLAIAGERERTFLYDPHSEDSTRAAMIMAMEWVENALPPPATRISKFRIYLKALQFWKYDFIWKGHSLIALLPKNHNFSLEDIERLRHED